MSPSKKSPPGHPGDGPVSSPVLERIALEMATSLDVEEVLATITKGVIDELDAAFVRIWLIGPGDLCADCHKAAACRDRARCLHLRASAGISTNLDGEFRRVPLGGLKIGRIAQGWGPMSTNDVRGDDRLPNKRWLEANALRAFAGYPLEYRGELLGVLALFSRRALSQHELDRLPIFSSQAAVAVKTAQLFAETTREKDRYHEDSRYLREEIRQRYDAREVLGESPSFRQVIDCIEQVAPTTATVLLHGETGTGKELLARAIHEFSRRRGRPLVKVNCAAVPASLIESEFFGHEKGAFTGATSRRIGRFELADGGTIFLDEVGELPLELQAKLLRVLQEREFERLGDSTTRRVDVRVVAATNRDLQQATREGAFREDLYYRLNVFPVRVPPLRERPEDIPRLAWHFVHRYATDTGRGITEIPDAVMETLRSYRWPGNVRELENVIERAVILSRGTALEVEDDVLGTGLENDSAPRSDDGTRTLEDVQRRHILSVLRSTQGVIQGRLGAAQVLGLRPSTLRSLMQRLGIERGHVEPDAR